MKWFFLTFIYFAFTNKVICQSWDSLGSYTYGESKHCQIYDNKLLVGGIDTSQGVSTFNLSTWDGNIWETVGGGIDGQVYSTSLLNGRLFVGGSFNYAGGPYPWPAAHIYQLTAWDGIQYFNFNYPNGSIINELRTFNDELYVGTNIVTINGQTFYGILKYNDTTWADVGGGLNGFPRDVHVMEEYNSNLIAGGEFSIAGSSLSVINIASWNGSSWNQLGNGLNAAVRTFVVDTINNILYAGGSFYYSDTVQVNHVAKWDGVSWQKIGLGVPIIVTALCFYNNELYAGGGNAWGIYPSSLYKWNGSVWTPIIPGPLGNINSLKVYQGSLYVSGGFSEIGGVRYSGIAKYTDSSLVSIEIDQTNDLFSIYPNPTNESISIYFSKPMYKKLEILIYNIKGELVFQKNYTSVNERYILVDYLFSKNGMYFCKIRNFDVEYSTKFIVY